MARFKVLAFTTSWLLLIILSAQLSLARRAPRKDDEYGHGSAARSGHPRIGINYGRDADNIPPPKQAVALMKQLGVGSVRIFDSDPEVLSALAHSGLPVIIRVKNQDIMQLARSEQAAAEWVQTNIKPFYPVTQIITVEVGNNVLSNHHSKANWQYLVPAMRNMQASLTKAGLAGKILVSTSLDIDILGTSFPPSAGRFRDDIANSIMKPLLQFLSDNSSPFFLNVYPYHIWDSNQEQIALQYALFNGSDPVVDGELSYTNLLDEQLDAVWAAMDKLGFPELRLEITETGWPTRGGAGASPEIAALYNQRLVNKMLAVPSQGTPMHPGTFIPTYLFALFNEDQKRGPALEKHWGLLYPNGSRVYNLNLIPGNEEPAPSPEPYNTPTVPFRAATPTYFPTLPPSSSTQDVWCVAKVTASIVDLQNVLDTICEIDSTSFCRDIMHSGDPCYEPSTLVAHASYAINAFWQSQKANGATCDFYGIAGLTSINPSHGSCVYINDGGKPEPPPLTPSLSPSSTLSTPPASLPSTTPPVNSPTLTPFLSPSYTPTSPPPATPPSNPPTLSPSLPSSSTPTTPPINPPTLSLPPPSAPTTPPMNAPTPPPTPSTLPAASPPSTTPAFSPLTAPTPTPGLQWCIAKENSTDISLQQALDFVCGTNTAFCDDIQNQQPCFNPNTLLAHASFAMNAYWKANKANCDFGGIGEITNTNPSHDSCEYIGDDNGSPAPTIFSIPTPSPSSPVPTPSTLPAASPRSTTPAFSPLTAPTPTPDLQWCIAKENSTDISLQQALDFVCGSNSAFCDDIQNQQPCFNPNTLLAHASFAMNAYWQANKANCDFDGIGEITNTNPSHGSCIFVSN